MARLLLTSLVVYLLSMEIQAAVLTDTSVNNDEISGKSMTLFFVCLIFSSFKVEYFNNYDACSY